MTTATAAPPRTRRFGIEHLAAFDDEALSTFLGCSETSIDPAVLGAALGPARHRALAARIARVLTPRSAAVLEGARAAACGPAAVREAERRVVAHLFWPLLYWHDPAAYEELVAGEDIDPAILAELPLDGRLVADLGAGCGRFTLLAAARARRVIAIDAVPAMLDRLSAAVRASGVSNVSIRRGCYSQLPLADGEVDVAVACSSLTSRPPAGGERALADAERVVRRGGLLAVIWPDAPAWFAERGFRVVRGRPRPARRFLDVGVAERLCRDFYGDRAAVWVRRHRSATVPYEVLGIPSPRALCLKTIG